MGNFMTKKLVSLLSGISGIIIAALIYFTQVRKFPSYAVESTRYATFLLIVFAILCYLLLVVTLFQKSDGARPVWVKAPSKFTFTVVLMFVYVLSLEYIGFYVASVAFMLVLAPLLGLRRPLLLITCTVLLLAIVYGVFVHFLSVPVPLGVFEELTFSDIQGSIAKAIAAWKVM